MRYLKLLLGKITSGINLNGYYTFNLLDHK